MSYHTSSARTNLKATKKRKDVENSSFCAKTNSSKGSFGISNKRLQKQTAFSDTTSSSSNQLLAGYMAHEYLTRGTLFGQKFDPTRPEPVSILAADSNRRGAVEAPTREMTRTYADVAQLLKSDGTHIPGVVNPTQLARWIQM